MKNKRRIYMWMTLIWVGVIFAFSLQPAEASSQISMGFGRWLVDTFLPGFLERLESMSEEQLENLHFLLRKCGHFSEFFVLGVLSMLTLLQTKLRYRSGAGIAFCVLVASMDETIQLFVSGRSGQISDVLLDSVGATVGIFCLLGAVQIINSKKSRGRQHARFILHLTAAKMLLNRLDDSVNQNDFFIGNIVPDTVKDKSVSHFRSPARFGKKIEYPELEPFLDKYKSLLDDSSVLGYYYHLYIDRKFFKEYLPGVVTLLGADGQEESETAKVTDVRLERTGEVVPIERFFSEEYYYGDFTKMNTYLVERYQLPMDLDVNVKNPGIEEVDYRDVKKALKQLESYLEVPAEAAADLKVFELEELLAFLEHAKECFELKDKGYV